MNLTLFMQVLPKAGLGWLGVFAVTIIIVAAVELLEHFTNRKNKVQYRICRTTRCCKHRFPLAETELPTMETMRVPQPDIIEHFGKKLAAAVQGGNCRSGTRTTLKPFPLAEICRRWGFLKEGRSMAQPQCGKSLS